MNTAIGTFLDFSVVTGIALVVLLPPVVGAYREHRVTRQIRGAERGRDAEEARKGEPETAVAAGAGAVAGLVRGNRGRPAADCGGAPAVQLCGR